MDDEWLSEAEWRERFRPRENPLSPGSEAFEVGDPEQEAYVAAQDPRCVWSEMNDWQSGTTNLMSGYVPSGKDAIYWYVCEVPLDDVDDDGDEVTLFVELDDEWGDD